MVKSLEQTIVDSAKRFSEPVSKTFNVREPSSLEESLIASISDKLGEKAIQIGIDLDSVVLVKPSTSEILRRMPKSEAYLQLVNAVKRDHQIQQKVFEQALSAAQHRVRFSLLAASIGFLILLGGVVAMMLGYSTAGLVTSASGIVSELISVLFFGEARQANQRLDKHLERLLDSEGYFRSFAIANRILDTRVQTQMLEIIIKEMIGFEPDRRA